jgi:hypothetical protein
MGIQSQLLQCALCVCEDIGNATNGREVDVEMVGGLGSAAESLVAGAVSAYRYLNRPDVEERIAFLAQRLKKKEQEGIEEAAKLDGKMHWQYFAVSRNNIIARMAQIAFSDSSTDTDALRACSELAKIFGMYNEDALFYG